MKLVVAEAETETLRIAAGAWAAASSELVVAEVMRRARRQGDAAERVAAAVLEGLTLRPIDTEVIERATEVDPDGLRALDAIHLATALSMIPLPDAFISYDARLNDAASAAGLTVEAPA